MIRLHYQEELLLILEERKKFNHYISNPNEVEEILVKGAEKASITADKVLSRVRKKLGY